MLAWYLILLSSLTAVLSIATLGTVGNFNPGESDMVNLAVLAIDGVGLQTCNGKGPGVYCYEPLTDQYKFCGNGMDPSNIDGDTYNILGSCLVILINLTGDRMMLQNLGPAQKLRRRTSKIPSACTFGLQHIICHHVTIHFASGCKDMAKACQDLTSQWFESFNRTMGPLIFKSMACR